jgi:hypothetical protein
MLAGLSYVQFLVYGEVPVLIPLDVFKSWD